MRKGIDISSYNGDVNIDEIKKAGVDFAIIKIIRKDLHKDNQFVNNYKKCESAGLPWGVYNYSYAADPSKARSDMKLVCDILDNISKKCFEYGVWFDIEDEKQERLSKSQIAAILNAAQNVVENRGYKFGVYTGKSFYEENIDPAAVNCKNWWIARYYRGYDRMNIKENPNEKYKPTISKNEMMAWQYTSSGRFNKKVSTGNSGNFDLNILYKEFEVKKKNYTGLYPKLPSRNYFKNGDKGPEVKNVQNFLNWAIDAGLKVDGIYGDKTAEAVAKFQKAVKIKDVNGCFGKFCLKDAKEFKR